MYMQVFQIVKTKPLRVACVALHENKQREITRIFTSAELRFLCTARRVCILMTELCSGGA
jgi:hypothetical protein